MAEVGNPDSSTRSDMFLATLNKYPLETIFYFVVRFFSNLVIVSHFRQVYGFDNLFQLVWGPNHHV